MLPIGLGIVDQDTVAIASVVAAAGLVLVVGGWFDLLPKATQSERAAGAARGGLRIGLAVGGFLLTLSVSGWPVLAFYMGALGWFVPTLRSAKKERREAINRVEAIAAWVETIRDNISGAAGLTQALQNSASHSPEPIRSEVRDLVLRLQHEPLVPSLRKFAADVAHPTADMAVGCLILASSRSAGSLSSILSNTAQAARDSASMMRHVEAGRVQSQAQGKLVALLSGGMSLLMILRDSEFLSPYDSFGGQIALLLIGMIGAFATITMYQLGKPTKTKRVFSGVERGTHDGAVHAQRTHKVEI